MYQTNMIEQLNSRVQDLQHDMKELQTQITAETALKDAAFV